MRFRNLSDINSYQASKLETKKKQVKKRENDVKMAFSFMLDLNAKKREFPTIDPFYSEEW
jgi:hypothetical protein